MRNGLMICAATLLGVSSIVSGQERSKRSEPIGESQLRIGEEGVVWYARWDTAVAEAKRSNRPIFFMAAACQKGSVSGVF
jgi:hypothetical protein